MLRTDWRYFLEETQVFPSGDDKLNISYSHEEDEIFFTLTLSGEITFKGSDYTQFKTDYDAGEYCKVYTLYIEQKCIAGYEVKFLSQFSLFEGKFDFDRCTYKVTPTIQDTYSCIKRNQDTTIDLLNDTVTRHLITADYYSTLELYVFGNIDLDQACEIVTVINGTMQTDDEACIFNYPLTIAAREVIVLPKSFRKPDDTWLDWDGNDTVYLMNPVSIPKNYVKYVRDLTYVEPITINAGDIVLSHLESYMNSPDYLFMMQIGVLTDCGGSDAWHWGNVLISYDFKERLRFVTTELQYKNAISLVDSLAYAASQCADVEAFQSAFFTAETNPVTLTASRTANIYLIQKSDAKRPMATQEATKGEITWGNLINTVCNYFNCRWWIEDNTLRIEHISTIVKNYGIDLTVSPYSETTINRNRISFDTNRILKSESWNTFEYGNDDFKGLPITYADDCTTIGGKYNTKTYELSDIMTDLGYIQLNSDESSDTGFCMIACDGSDKVINEVGKITGNTIINGHLSIANLHDLYHRHNRVWLNGTLNGTSVLFESALKLRKLEPLSIVKCCDTEFNAIDSVTTALGTANVDSASYDLFSNKIKLDLLL
jgi:hypothetical protein